MLIALKVVVSIITIQAAGLPPVLARTGFRVGTINCTAN